MNLIEELERLPDDDRLALAMDYLRDLMGGDQTEIEGLRLRLGLYKSEALVFVMLRRRAGKVVPYASFELALDRSRESLRVSIANIRRKLADQGGAARVETVSLAGYRLVGDVDLPRARPAPEPYMKRQGQPWTEDEDQELRRMFGRGDCYEAIAFELERPVRGVTGRVRRFGLRR